jgi:hypothetical protein
MSLTFALEKAGPYDPHPDTGEALHMWRAWRHMYGITSAGTLWTEPTVQPKTGLNERWTLSLNLTAGRDNLCVNTSTCEDTCVTHQSFRARTDQVRRSREMRTQFLVQHPPQFGAVLLHEAQRALRKHPDAMARPNCNQDVAWERVFPWLADVLPMYDYTKRIDRVGWVAPQYRVTYSATSVTRASAVRRIVDRGDTVTMVFPVRKHEMPATWLGIPVVDGDVTDDRFADPAGVIVGLSPKGKLRGVTTHPLITPLA